MHADGTSGMRIAFPVLAGDFPGAVQGTASYAEAAKWVRLKYTTPTYPGLKFATMADSVGDAAVSWDHDGLVIGDNISLPDWQRGLIAIHMLIEKIFAIELDFTDFFLGFTGDHGIVAGSSTAGFNPKEGHCGTVEGVFTKFPIYHATKTFGPVLHKGASVVEMTGAPSGIVQLAMKYVSGGNTYVAVWLLNKLFHGALGAELGDQQTVSIAFPTATFGLAITNQRRFSASELDNPIVSGAVGVSGSLVSVTLPAFSSVSFIAEILPEGPQPEPPPTTRIIRALVAPRVIRAKVKP
jgi:hypothetical protein